VSDEREDDLIQMEKNDTLGELDDQSEFKQMKEDLQSIKSMSE
jgi:hypothetical protein